MLNSLNMKRSNKRFLPLGDFFPLNQSSLNQCQKNLKAKQNKIQNVEGELFRLNSIISDQKSEIFALKCQVNEKSLIPNPSHTSYASALKFPPPQKFTPLIKQCRPLMSLSFPTLSKSLSSIVPLTPPTPTTHYTPRYFLLNPRYSPPTAREYKAPQKSFPPGTPLHMMLPRFSSPFPTPKPCEIPPLPSSIVEFQESYESLRKLHPPGTPLYVIMNGSPRSSPLPPPPPPQPSPELPRVDSNSVSSSPLPRSPQKTQVRIYHDSNLKWSSPDKIMKNVKDLSLRCVDLNPNNLEISMTYTPRLEDMQSAIDKDDNTNGIVIISTLTNNVKDKQTVGKTSFLLQRSINSLKAQTSPENIIFLESPPSLRFDIFHHNQMAFQLCKHSRVRFAFNLLARSHIKPDGLHILPEFKHLMVKSVAAAIAKREPFSLLGCRIPRRHPIFPS